MKHAAIFAGALSAACFAAHAASILPPVSAATAIQPPGALYPIALGDLANLNLGGGRELVCGRGMAPGQGPLNNFTLSQSQTHFFCQTPSGARDISVCFAGWGQGPAELAMPGSVFQGASASVASGGTGYSVNDVIIEPFSTAAGDFRAMTIRVSGIDPTTGAVTAAVIENPGVYRAPVANGAAQAGVAKGVTYSTVAATGAGTSFQVSPFTPVIAGWAVTGTNVPASTTVVSWNSSTGIGVLSNSTTGGGLANNQVLTFTSTGTGATFNFTWAAFAYHVRVGVEPVYTGVAGVAITGFAANAVKGATLGNANPDAISPRAGNDFQFQMRAADILVPESGVVCSDPIPINAPPGSTIGLRIFSNGMSLRRAGFASAQEYFAAGLPPVADLSTSGTMAGNGGAGGNTKSTIRPIGVYGTPQIYKPSFAFIGDSLCFGTTGGTPPNDYDDGFGDHGFVERALGASLPWTSFCSPSNQIAYLFTSNFGRAEQLGTIQQFNISNVFQALSINDFNVALATATTVLSEEQQLAAELRVRGVRSVGSMTNFPQTNASNVANATSCPQLELRNANLRVGLKTDGSGNYAVPVGFVSSSGSVGPGAGTVTMASAGAMSQAGAGGSTFAIVPGATISIQDASPENVVVTAVTATTWSAVFVNAHLSPFAFTAQSGYAATYDYVMDWGTNFEASIGSCTWGNFAAMTGDGTHLLAGANGATGGSGHGAAAALLAPMIAKNAK